MPRALEGLNLKRQIYILRTCFPKNLEKIGKILSKLTKSCQKSQKLTEISQKMAKVGDFTAKIDFVERKKVKFFPFCESGGTCSPKLVLLDCNPSHPAAKSWRDPWGRLGRLSLLRIYNRIHISGIRPVRTLCGRPAARDRR